MRAGSAESGSSPPVSTTHTVREVVQQPCPIEDERLSTGARRSRSRWRAEWTPKPDTPRDDIIGIRVKAAPRSTTRAQSRGPIRTGCTARRALHDLLRLGLPGRPPLCPNDACLVAQHLHCLPDSVGTDLELCDECELAGRIGEELVGIEPATQIDDQLLPERLTRLTSKYQRFCGRVTVHTIEGMIGRETLQAAMVGITVSARPRSTTR